MSALGAERFGPGQVFIHQVLSQVLNLNCKLVSTRRALEKIFAANHHHEQEWGTASHHFPTDFFCFL